jgi:3-oxoacyl-[acyl-carrier-protein] synthase-3
MASFQFDGIRIAGVCCSLPKGEASVYDIGKPYFSEDEVKATTSSIGVEKLFIADAGVTASDLAVEAASKLMDNLGWKADEIGGLIFISQTPDHKLPASSFLIQHRLGLSKDCICLDINLGCSGFVNGYTLAANFITAGACDKVLVLTGDTLRRYISPEDKGLMFILSDAGTATGVERAHEINRTSVLLKSDGSGAGALIIPAGGDRSPISGQTAIMSSGKDGINRSEENLFMDGMGIFTFAIREVPELIRELLILHKYEPEDVSYYLLHQANAYMVKYISKRAKIPIERIPININKYGNTNGSTIPFLIHDLASNELLEEKDVILCGFGVGLSWGGIATRLGALDSAEIVRI